MLALTPGKRSPAKGFTSCRALTERDVSIRDFHCIHRRATLSYAALSCREGHSRWCQPLATSRGIVNGCTSEMDSLTLDDNSPTLEETLAKMRPNDTEVALDQPPLSINVIPHLPQEEMALLLALAAG